MKKKILIGLGAIALAVLLSINVTFITNDSKSELSLNAMGMILQAEAEDDGAENNMVCIEDECIVTTQMITYSSRYKHCIAGSGSCNSDCNQGCDPMP